MSFRRRRRRRNRELRSRRTRRRDTTVRTSGTAWTPVTGLDAPDTSPWNSCSSRLDWAGERQTKATWARTWGSRRCIGRQATCSRQQTRGADRGLGETRRTDRHRGTSEHTAPDTDGLALLRWTETLSDTSRTTILVHYYNLPRSLLIIHIRSVVRAVTSNQRHCCVVVQDYTIPATIRLAKDFEKEN